jgi:hypothetical protein
MFQQQIVRLILICCILLPNNYALLFPNNTLDSSSTVVSDEEQPPDESSDVPPPIGLNISQSDMDQADEILFHCGEHVTLELAERHVHFEFSLCSLHGTGSIYTLKNLRI